jgi:translation initiation factor 2B subunit (eIF-2B alpha/beta/delta family)
MIALKRFILSLSALLLLSGIALAAPAMARDGISGNASAEDSTTGSESQTEVENHARDLTEQFKQSAQADLAAKKAQIKEQTQEHRQKACEARKTNLTKRMSNAVRQAQNHKAVFDKIYTRVKDFHDNKQLSVDNYDTLVANIDKAQADAATSISALQTLDISVDCASQTVAVSVSAFQQAVKDSRDSLKAYRSSITELIKALKGASTSADKSGSDSNQTEAQ